MTTHRFRITVLALAVVFARWSTVDECRAGFRFLGPTPYLSEADSPFPVGGTNPHFFLEDFEANPDCIPGEFTFCGGTFDAPGATMIYGGTGQFNSVDADDGVIDGTGASGFSAIAFDVWFSGSASLVAVGFEFDANALGFLPTAVGFVLTDGAGQLSALTVYDADGNDESLSTWDIQLDPLTTSDDRFVGVINPHGISSVIFFKTILDSNLTAYPRIDHLQYGLLVPEPHTLHLVYSAMATLGASVIGRIGQRHRLIQRRKQDVSKQSTATQSSTHTSAALRV